MREPHEPVMMTREEVAEALRVSVRTLAELRRRTPLPCYRFGRAVRFRRADVEAWVEAHRVAEDVRPTAAVRTGGRTGRTRRTGRTGGTAAPWAAALVGLGKVANA